MAGSRKSERETADANPLARIDAQIAALQAVRETMAKALALGLPIGLGGIGSDIEPIGFSVGGVQTVQRGPIELPVGAFRNKSIPDAIKLFLAAARQKQTIRQIAEGLKDGGLESTARHFETTVTGALHRLKNAGTVLKFKDGRWDLADSYPDHIRKSIATDSKPVSRRPTRKRKRESGEAKVEARVPKLLAPPNTANLVLRHLEAHPQTAASLAGLIGQSSNVVGLAIGRLAKAGKIAKNPDGTYALTDSQQPALRAV